MIDYIITGVCVDDKVRICFPASHGWQEGRDSHAKTPPGRFCRTWTIFAQSSSRDTDRSSQSVRDSCAPRSVASVGDASTTARGDTTHRHSRQTHTHEVHRQEPELHISVLYSPPYHGLGSIHLRKRRQPGDDKRLEWSKGWRLLSQETPPLAAGMVTPGPLNLKDNSSDRTY